MAKSKIVSMYYCQNCGYESPKWMGQCPGCKEWNIFVEEQVNKSATGKEKNHALDRKDSTPLSLKQIDFQQEERLSTNFKELDRVLGGGIVAGSLILVGGDPGIGKSTLLLQVCRELSSTQDVLYISGEESLKQAYQISRYFPQGLRLGLLQLIGGL